MRMAMSCLAWPVLGRPTRRARLSCSSVNSGISEKSIWLSGIGFPLFAARLPRADDANAFLAMFQPPERVDHRKHPPSGGDPEPLRATLGQRMFNVFPIQTFRIAEHRSCFFKSDAMLFVIADRLLRLPREHFIVYTLIAAPSQKNPGRPQRKLRCGTITRICWRSYEAPICRPFWQLSADGRWCGCANEAHGLDSAVWGASERHLS